MLNLDWGLMVWTLITFGLAMFILWRYAFGPLQKAIDERRRKVQDSLEASEEARDEAFRLLNEYKKTLASVRTEADNIMENARSAGDQAKAEMMQEAHKQAARAIERAHGEIERDTRAAIATLRNEVADLTMAAAGKVVGKSLSDEEHKRLVEEAIREIESADIKMGERRC